ncbi:hypothetical protein JZ751_012132 [Albula glossodonta]|uniref:EGF-like domain-containing protein n=1 Tax=Albula glossodonta TaxID=121402 RepID=A0A8T2PRQ5_9TELE|nr:hypothetical protein JZ751_012132 [Albula glossodonta]
MCGKLFCSNGNHCEQAGLSDCRSTDNQDSGQDQNMVDTGTRCGEGMVCNDNQCVGLEMAYGPINCSGKCTGHAVCNHKSQCQCEPGWLPPTCELLDDSGRTLSTGAVIAIVIATTAALVLLLALIGMAVLLKHRQKLVHSPRLPSHTKDLAQDNPAFNTEINTVYKK